MTKHGTAIIVDDSDLLQRQLTLFFETNTSLQHIVCSADLRELQPQLDTLEHGQRGIRLITSDFDIHGQEIGGRILRTVLERVSKWQSIDDVLVVLVSARYSYNEEVQAALADVRQLAPKAQFLCKAERDYLFQWQFLLAQMGLWVVTPPPTP